MKVRPRKPGDEPAVASLIAAVAEFHARGLPAIFRQAPTGVEAPLERGDLAHEVFVAEDAGAVIGTVDVRVRLVEGNPLVRERRIGYVTQLSVAEAARGRGAGRALMDAAAAWAREHECGTIELGVYEFNAAALALYHSLGYETVSRRMSLSL